jgi:hypothetical protein
MNHINHIHISGVNFTIECRDAEISLPVDSAYTSFKENSTNSFEDVNVKVYLETDSLPKTNGLRKIFDSESSWSAFLDKNIYYISLQPKGFDQYIWLAKIRPGFREVVVYCSSKLMSWKNGQLIINSPVCYPLDQILLMYILGTKKGALIHAAGADFMSKGFVFPGKSGAGKSTIARQFMNHSKWSLLSDDRIVVRDNENSYFAYGTPWPGEAGIAENRKVPIAGVFFLKQAVSNKIREIDKREACEKMFPVVSIPWYDRKIFPEIMGCCENITFNIPCYELSFFPGSEVVDVLERFAAA